MKLELKQIYNKLKNGDHLEDIELKYGINEFSLLEETLSELGDRFYLAWKEIHDVNITLKVYLESRKYQIAFSSTEITLPVK